MTGARTCCLAIAIAALLLPLDGFAQGRGRGAGDGRGGDDRERGPRFCRNGEGHPVFGWEWCQERGWGRDRIGFPRTSPDTRRYPSPDREPFPDRNRQVNDRAFDNGYADGYEKGLDDGRDRREYDPVRHRWYREGDRGYDSSDGSRAQYQNVYREGFRSGYESGYRDGERSESDRGGFRLPWPF